MTDTTHTDTSPAAARESLNRIPGKIPGALLAVLGLMVVLGLVGFVLGLRSTPQRAWQIYLVNFLFFSGLAAAGVIFGVVMTVAKGHWGKGIYRVAQGFGFFMPVSYVLFLLLYLGRNLIFPWIGGGGAVNMEGHALPAFWFNIDNLFLRGAFFLFVLYALSFVFIYFSLRPDMQDAAGRLEGWRRKLVDWIGRDFKGGENEAARSRRILGVLSPILVLGYVFILSGMAVDLIMSLEPGWISVLFPAYFFVGAWLSGLCGLAVMGTLLQKRLALNFASTQWHDLGKLIFAFCIFWAYLWFSQFLVIWYGNLPRETVFIDIRSREPWLLLSLLFFFFVFVLPFILLLWQKVKMVPPYLASVAGLILVGFWLERFDMVVPSIWDAGTVPIGLIEILITVGFLGLFGLSYAAYASTFPLVPLRDSLIVGKARTGPY